MIKRVGLIGLGKMGLPMARHLKAGGFDVCAYDLDDAKVAAAKALGVAAAPSVADVADNSDLVIVIVGFDNEVLDVVNGPQGLFSRARPGLVIAIGATVSIDTMRRLNELAEARSVDILDIPSCRGEIAAEQGKLLLLAGGKEEVYERCLPAFKTFGSDCYFLGPVGSGQVGKMINNLLLWAAVSANHEGLKLAEALGVSSEALRPALLKSSGSNWALETWLQPRPMPWAEKDMSIVMDEADSARLSLPLCGVIREVIKGIKIEKGLPNPKLTKT